MLTLLALLGAVAVSLAAEVGQQPLNINATEDAKEKSYRLYVGEQEMVTLKYHCNELL